MDAQSGGRAVKQLAVMGAPPLAGEGFHQLLPAGLVGNRQKDGILPR